MEVLSLIVWQMSVVSLEVNERQLPLLSGPFCICCKTPAVFCIGSSRIFACQFVGASDGLMRAKLYGLPHIERSRTTGC